MCGIAVAIDWDGAEATVRRLISGLSHRGDVTDPLVSPRPNVAMCTRRLRIVDAEHAIQPMLSYDGRILLSFNGEIYNHAELRQELEACGVGFRTESDTEVLASALSLWGPGALGRINGMFAFVALDLSSGDFLAARDPLGVKPLYVIQSGSGFVFCSEMRPLLSGVEAGYVFPLPPGHLLTRTRLTEFKSFVADPDRATFDHDPAVLDRLLSAAVQARIPPDMPCPVLFSGGIDSTLIAHYARQTRPDTPAYFLGGADAPDYSYAACYAARTGLDLRCVGFDDVGDDTDACITEIIELVETFEPDVVRGSLCTALLSRRIHRDGYKVALCGEGADELFAGYVPLELAFDDSQWAGAVVRDQHLALMHNNNLQRVDRCSMRYQLELREPFLDPSIVAYATGLKSSSLVRTINGEAWGKAPLRSLYDLYPDQLPDMIRDRRKVPGNEGSGFDVGPNDSPWRTHAEQTISDAQFSDGKRLFESFDLRTKEEFLYLSKLAELVDVSRIPHLKIRARLRFPTVKNMERLSQYIL